jgi:hypothetical protein
MRKIIQANYTRNEYDKDVFTEAIMYSVELAPAAPLLITHNYITSIAVAADVSATDTRIQFGTLVGNLPWSSYSKFVATNPRTDALPPVPTESLPNAGAVLLYRVDGSDFITETVYYGSITWTSQTAGYLNNVKRASASGGTSYAFSVADGSVGFFFHTVPVREYLKLWNRTGATLYIGSDGSLDNTTNSVQLADGGEWGMWVEPMQDIWLYSAAGASIRSDRFVTIVEYR